MSSSTALIATKDQAAPVSQLAFYGAPCAFEHFLPPLAKTLRQAFAVPFVWMDPQSAQVVHWEHGALNCDYYDRMELLRVVSRRGKPEIIEDASPLTVLAIPIRACQEKPPLVAVGVFAKEKVQNRLQVAAAARSLGVDSTKILEWLQGQETWSHRQLLSSAELVLQKVHQENKLAHLRSEINHSISQASDTFIELGLLHRIAQHLDFSSKEVDLWNKAVSWLAPKISAQVLVIVPNLKKGGTTKKITTMNQESTNPQELVVSQDELLQLIHHLGSPSGNHPLVLRRQESFNGLGPYSALQDLVCVPIMGGDEPSGWLLAINSQKTKDKSDRSFSPVETRVLSSVARILSLHSSSVRLRRDEHEFFIGTVLALLSALDAKDGYTAGHSQRVARISVLLAKQLKLPKNQINSIYLAGLLHDIGKIGVDENILKKTGKLSKKEFDEIKRHPQLGWDILKGVRQLEHVLPVVLHHHEAWNGKGYPHGLQKEETPILARIVAVADSYDAMVSDRPYRAGLAIDELEKILLDGAGSQWDPEIIDAYFKIQDQVHDVSNSLAQAHSAIIDFEDSVV